MSPPGAMLLTAAAVPQWGGRGEEKSGGVGAGAGRGDENPALVLLGLIFVCDEGEAELPGKTGNRLVIAADDEGDVAERLEHVFRMSRWCCGNSGCFELTLKSISSSLSVPNVSESAMDDASAKIAPTDQEASAQSAFEGDATSSEPRPKKPAKKPKPAKPSEAKKDKPASKKPAPAPWTFPKNTLEEAIKIPRAIEEQNAGNPMKPDILAKAVGFNAMADWRFLDLLRSANLYGLVIGVGKIQPVALTDIGRDVVAPSSPSARPRALIAAFRTVEDFRKVEEFYKGKKLPEDEFFENTLYREFNIPRERVRAFIETFTSNLNYVHAFRADRSGPGPIIETDLRQQEPEVPGPPDEGTGRQFLDTCFVMMPFGQWMDSYYREIYVPAIKEAGLEPIRADELFSTGSVIEQIWEQISRAKVLLADLSGKNANVFYELGLAHAARKPVVFTTGELEDVPFDLRHLRVAVYDVRDPSWGEKLRSTLSVYLKAAKAEPSKSVPQPFRRQAAEATA